MWSIYNKPYVDDSPCVRESIVINPLSIQIFNALERHGRSLDAHLYSGVVAIALNIILDS